MGSRKRVNRHGRRTSLRAECRLALAVGIMLLVVLLASSGGGRRG